MTVFPFNLPGPTATYLGLYLVTLALHFVFMSYVLAGTGYLAISAVRGRDRESAVAGILRDWLPFALGTAITAGVAPLLFLQVLYKEHFYTANLLLFYRWLAVVPVLIAGFYLLYLQKSAAVARWSALVRRAIPLAAFVCFAFTAYSWTENHLLSLDRAAWTGMYAAGEHSYFSAQLIPRVLFFAALSVPTMCAIIGWQARYKGAEASAGTARHLALIAGLSVLAAGAGLLAYGYILGRDVHQAVTAQVGSVSAHLGLIVLGGLAQLIAWVRIWRAGELDRRPLWAASVGSAVTILGVLAAREAVRATAVGILGLEANHERAAESGGMWVFAVFAVIAIGLIAWCFQMTARALRK